MTLRGRLQQGEVQCFTLPSVELESQTNPNLASGLLILTTHRLLWIPNDDDAATSPFCASGIPLKSVSRIFSTKMPVNSISNPKSRFQLFTSQGKLSESTQEDLITFLLTGKSDPDAFLIRFWAAWGGRAWEKSTQEGLSGSKSDEEIEKNEKTSRKYLQEEAKFVDSGGGFCDIPEQKDLEIFLSIKDFCTRCNKGGRLLVCSEVSCPLAFHKECMPQNLSITGMDNFYCSYCSYKRAFLRTCEKRKALLLAKKNLSLFLGEISANSHMQKASEVASHPIILGEMTSDETAMQMNEDELVVHSRQLENDHEVERATLVDENQEVEGRFDAKPDDVGHQIERDIQVDEQQEAEEPNGTEMQEQDVEPSNRSNKIKSRSLEQKEKTRSRSVEQKDKTPTKVKTRSRSLERKEKTPTTVKFRSRTMEHEEEVEDSLESSLRESSHEEEVEDSVDSSLNVKHKGKTTTTTSNESKPHHFRSPRNKRKKCLWRVEEEEMLKEGVKKFSTKIKKNIPWKKLLEFGSHVFDNSRTARDLKDKWKNL